MLSDTTQPFASPYLGKVAEIEANAQRGSEELPKLVADYKTDAQYPARISRAASRLPRRWSEAKSVRASFT